MTEFYNEDLVEGILRDRYYSNGETSWAEVSHRVSRYVASGGVAKGLSVEEIRARESAYRKIIAQRLFLPNSPTLFNAGVNTDQFLMRNLTRNMTFDDYLSIYSSRESNGSLSACFVVPIEDSMKDIYRALSDAALITKSGGGVGFSFSRLRPKGSMVGGTGGFSSGPCAFMEVFDKSARVVRQGGRRRAAMMAVLRYDHPDILDFIHSKRNNDGTSVLSYFNISVDVDPDKFLQLYKNGGDIILTHERTGQTGVISAWELLQLIAENAWKSGDPGMLFTERHNRTSSIGNTVKVEASNPCVTGETLVAVADGRNYISIKQLAEEGEDVPVYSQGENGIEVKMGRNPRLTRRNAEILKVTLDDGSSIRATKDHKFMLRDSTYRETQNLSAGDSLMPFSKFHREHHGHTYWNICRNNNGVYWDEHRLISEYINGPEQWGFVTHHKDGNGLNNNWDNLERISQHEHNKLEINGGIMPPSKNASNIAGICLNRNLAKITGCMDASIARKQKH